MIVDFAVFVQDRNGPRKDLRQSRALKQAPHRAAGEILRTLARRAAFCQVTPADSGFFVRAARQRENVFGRELDLKGPELEDGLSSSSAAVGLVGAARRCSSHLFFTKVAGLSITLRCRDMPRFHKEQYASGT